MIPYGRQDISNADVAAVTRVLRSDFLTQGPEVPAFEEALATYCGVAHGIAMNSATSALHVACLALGVGPGDRVWTSPITFAASANCALYCGAVVDFVDIDGETFNMSVVALSEKLERAATRNELPKVVIPVHLCGESCDMRAIHTLSERYGFRVIEDASHAVGGRYLGKPVGDCRYSDITVFSFHPVKIITSAEGGMAMTQDDALAGRMRLFRTHGITRDPALMTRPDEGAWYYEQIDLGLNYRLTDLQAALGRSQLTRIDQFVTRRHEIASRYDRAFSSVPVRLQRRGPDAHSALHLYVIRVDLNRVGSRRTVFDALRASGIGVNLHYLPVYRHPYYQRFGFDPSRFPEAEGYYAEAITIPMYAGLTDEQQTLVIDAVTRHASAKDS